MATPKQVSYIKALLTEKGFINPRYGSFHGIAKTLPHGPSMRERAGSVDVWIGRLTVKQASEVIEALRVTA